MCCRSHKKGMESSCVLQLKRKETVNVILQVGVHGKMQNAQTTGPIPTSFLPCTLRH